VAGIEREEAVGQIFEPMLALFGFLGELGIARPARLSATTERLSARQMVQVGRLGAAQRIIEKELNTFTLPVEEARLDDYVRLCIDLSEAGASEAAAVRLARVESRLSTVDHYWVNDARELLREIRTAGNTAISPEQVGTSVKGHPDAGTAAISRSLR